MKDEKIFKELSDDFILERLNNLLLESENEKKYDLTYQNFVKTLNENQKNIFEQLINSLNALSSNELIIAYKTGFKDFFRMTINK